jgi:hypothetical protein
MIPTLSFAGKPGGPAWARIEVTLALAARDYTVNSSGRVQLEVRHIHAATARTASDLAMVSYGDTRLQLPVEQTTAEVRQRMGQVLPPTGARPSDGLR